MATEAQVNANRSNAQKSTGPRTPRGKAAVAQNALRHGLRAQRDVVEGEDQEQFDLHRSRLLGELAPDTPMEDELADRIVRLTWRLRRADRVQDEAFEALLALQSQPASTEMACTVLPDGQMKYDVNYGKFEPVLREELWLGHAMVKDFSETRVLDRLQMYEQRIERSLFRTMRELEHLRLARQRESAGRGTRAVADSAKQSQSNPASTPQETVGQALPCETAGQEDSVKQNQSRACEETPYGVATNGICPDKQSQSSVVDGASNPACGTVTNKANLQQGSGSGNAPDGVRRSM